jgi:hypothetical protein
MGDGSCALLAAALAGDVLRTAVYTFWKAARKLRWVCKGIRTGGGLEARPQAAAGGAREAATPTANAAAMMDAPVQYTVLAKIPATNPADAHSPKEFGLHQPRPSPDSPSPVTGSSTAATTPRPPACHGLADLCGQDSVRSSDGFDGMYKKGDSESLGY